MGSAAVKTPKRVNLQILACEDVGSKNICNHFKNYSEDELSFSQTVNALRKYGAGKTNILDAYTTFLYEKLLSPHGANRSRGLNTSSWSRGVLKK